MSDSSFIRKLKLKDEEMFARFFQSYKNLVFYECNNILKRRPISEDVTQEVFIEFFNNIDKLDESTNLKLYIASLAKKRATDQYRKESKSNLNYVDHIEEYVDPQESIEIDPLLTINHLLDDIEARIVSLRIIYEFTFQEIAKLINLTLGQVQSRYYKAIKKLKNHYKKGN